MTEFLPEEPKVIDFGELSRRDLLRFGAAVAISYQAPWLLTEAAKAYDNLTSPEDLIAGPVPVLEPRTDNTPSVEPEECGQALRLPATCVRGTEVANVTFELPSTQLWAEHTGTPVRADVPLQAAGTAIITGSGGPERDNQEYCMLFTTPGPGGQVLAVGYQGGLYTYERALAQGEGGTSGEWVRVLGQGEDATLASPALVGLSLKGLEFLFGSSEPLVKQVIKGTETLQNIGYRPWAAVLPSTKMPDMINKDLTRENCTATFAEVCNGKLGKSYFISERGDFIDANHMRDKSGQTLDLFMRLFCQRAAGVTQPTATIAYGTGSKASFEFAIDPKSLEPEQFMNTVYAVMQTEGMIMEGIAQRLVLDDLPPPLKAIMPEAGGLGPEDLFSNSLAVTGMLSLIKHYDLDKKLQGVVQATRRRNPHASAEDLQADVHKAMEEFRPLLVKQVIAEAAHALGVRRQKLPLSIKLPRGLYSLVPTKISDEDARTPTRINTRALGIRSNNPGSRFHATDVPAMETVVERALSELQTRTTI